MTQDLTKMQLVDITDKLTFNERATVLLTQDQLDEMTQYINKGGVELALSTANSFFELYITGSSIDEIHRLNPTFPRASISWACIKYNWEKTKVKYITELQGNIAEKVMKAQLEVTGLYCDILAVANKKHGAKIKKYLQTGKEDELDDALGVQSLNQLVKMADALHKFIGQDKKIPSKKEENKNINVNFTSDSSVNPNDAAKVLKILAGDKRKNK